MITRRNTLITGAAAAAYLPITSRLAQAQQARTMLLAANGTPEGFDGDALRPGTQDTVVQVYEGLVTYGGKIVDGRPYLDPSKFEGHLAESWKASDDGKTWVFTLRSGVKSPYGNELSAADVEWSWAKSFAQKRTGAFIGAVSNVTAVKAISQREVQFTLSAPSSILLSALTLYVPGIYDTTEMKKHTTADDPWALNWLDSHTAGYGAYHCESVTPGQQAVFVANPNYFKGKPFFERVIYRSVPSSASRITLLRSGQVHWIGRPTVQQVVELKKDPKAKIEDASGRASASLRMNCAIAPFDDVRVRQAFNYGVDKAKLKQAVMLGTGEEFRSIVAPEVPSYDPSVFHYDYDPDKARALLKDAGHASGLEVPLYFADLWWWEEQMAVLVADQLKGVGVNVKLTRITGSEMRSRTAPGKSDLPFLTFEDGPIVLDPVYNMYLLARSDGVSNRARYANKRVDELIDQGRTTLDNTVRDRAMREAQKLWMDDAPWVMTFYPQIFEAMAPNISGWVPWPDDHERWVDLKMG